MTALENKYDEKENILYIIDSYNMSACSKCKNCFCTKTESDFELLCLITRQNLKYELRKSVDENGILKFEKYCPLPITSCSHCDNNEKAKQ